MPVKKDPRKEKRLNRRQERQMLKNEIDKEVNGVLEDEVKEEVKEPKKRPRKIDKTKIFVLDTNVLLACPDIIYDSTDPDWRKPLHFDPNLDGAHLVIPSVVHDELEGIKKGTTGEQEQLVWF